MTDFSRVPEEGTEERKLWDKVLKLGFTDKSKRSDFQLVAGQVDVTMRHYTLDEGDRILSGLPPVNKEPLSGLRRFSQFAPVARQDEAAVVVSRNKNRQGIKKK